MTDTNKSDRPDAFNPVPGIAETIEPGLRRILAPNPSPMTFRGTNTYLLGVGGLAIIDPGPDSPEHLEAILAAVRPGQHISHIVVTHGHRDHSSLARSLADRTSAPILAFGKATAGRSAAMERLAARGLTGGGEGLDLTFTPDRCLSDGAQIDGDGWTIQAIHTPGHIGNHIALAWNDTCFSGDHVMGWASSVVSPPDGDVSDFMSSCEKLLRQEWRVFYPGHGAPISSPASRIRWLIAHRRTREAAILSALANGPATPHMLAARIYSDTPAALLPMATRNVFAHLIDLNERNLIVADGCIGETTTFHRP